MRWQLRLLYESMRQLDIADDLLVGLTDSPYEEPEPIDYCNTFKHANLGVNLGYTPINKPFAVTNAVSRKLINLPFTLIDPDMVFLKPIPQENESIVAQYVWHMELKYLEEEVGWNFLKDLEVEKGTWHPVGCVYQFNEVPKDYFEEVYHYCADLVALYKPGDGKLKIEPAYWVREMLAWALPMMNLKVKPVNYFQMPLDPSLRAGETDSDDSCLIHYCGSFKPWFDKHKFCPTHPEFEVKSPFEVLLSIPSEIPRVVKLKNIIQEMEKQNDC